MAILDFMRNRQQKTTAKPALDDVKSTTAPQRPSNVIPASELAKAREIGERLKRATMHIQGGASAGEGGSNAALLQKQNNQHKAQAAMSPTDRSAGKTALQQKSRGRER